MCKMKSGLILKDRVFIPDYDSHSDMLEELGINDTEENAERLFVRAELSPSNGDVFSPVDTWAFNVDQDIVPEWFVKDVEKDRMVEAVKEWAKDHIHIGVDSLKINSGSNHYIKDCKDVEIYGSATVKDICGSATVKDICGSATVEYIYGSATVKNIYGSATVKNICGSATVKNICGSATVEYICGSATVIGSPYGWENKDKFILSNNATFKDHEAKVIYQSGDWELRLVNNVLSEDSKE